MAAPMDTMTAKNDIYIYTKTPDNELSLGTEGTRYVVLLVVCVCLGNRGHSRCPYPPPHRAHNERIPFGYRYTHIT